MTSRHLSIRFSFGAHAAEDVWLLPRIVLQEARDYLSQPDTPLVYFRESAATPMSFALDVAREFAAGRSPLKIHVLSTIHDKRQRASLLTTLANVEGSASAREPTQEDLRGLARLEQSLERPLFSVAEMYFLERLRRHVPFELDGESFPDLEIPARRAAEQRSRQLERLAAEHASQGDAERALNAYAEALQVMAANLDHRNARIIARLAAYADRAASQSTIGRVFVRLGRKHDILVEQLEHFLGPAIEVESHYDSDDGIELPTDRLDRDLISGRRQPERSDYVAGLFASLVEGLLVARGTARRERRQTVLAASSGMSADKMERVILRARVRGLSGSVQDVLDGVGVRPTT